MKLYTFSEFISELVNAYPSHKDEIIAKAKNWTTQRNAGHTTNLYEAQFNWYAIEYTLEKKWIFHFNGYTGEGSTLQEASDAHSEAYKEYLYS